MSYIIPTVHPAAVRRAEGALPISDVIASDLAKAYRISKTGPQHRETIISVLPNGPVDVRLAYEAACSWMERWLRTKPPVAFDVESSSLDWFRCKFYTTGIAVGGNDNVGLAFPHTDLSKLPEQWENHLLSLKRQILEDPEIPKVFHNAAFDLAVLDTFGYKTQGQIIDTLGLHQMVQPDIPHKLDWIAQTYLDVLSWKADFKEDSGYGEAMADKPWELLVYNAKDALYTAQLVAELVEDVKLRGMSTGLMKQHMEYIELSRTMEQLGQPVNILKRRSMGMDLLKRILRYKTGMAKFLNWPDFNPMSTKHKMEVLFGPKYARAPFDMGFEPGKTTKTGQPSTSYKSVIDHLEHPFVAMLAGFSECRSVYATQYREGMDQELRKLRLLEASPEQMGGLPGDHDADLEDEFNDEDVLNTIQRQKQKIEKDRNKDSIIRGGAFQRAIVEHPGGQWGTMYCSWKMFSQKTLRAAAQPNSQNRRSNPYNPMGEDLSWTEAPPGYKLVGGDKDQLELRLIAARAGVPNLIRVLNGQIAPTDYGCMKGKPDPHLFAATEVYGLEDFLSRPAEEQAEIRGVVKSVEYAGFYLAGWMTVWRTCRENKKIPMNVRMKMTKDVVKAVWTDLFHGVFKEIYEWHTDNLQFVEENGYLEIPSGRRRWTPERPPPATEYANWGIQCYSGDTRVSTTRGHLRIKGVQTGRLVVPGTTASAEFKRVERGVSEIMSISLSDGSHPLKVSPDHEWLCQQDEQWVYKKASSLAQGDLICKDLPPREVLGSNVRAKSFLYWLGAMISDAATSGRSPRLFFGTKKLKREKDLARQFFLFCGRQGWDPERPKELSNALTGVKISTSNSGREKFKSDMATWGYDLQWTCYTKKVPEVAFSSGVWGARQFLWGMLDGDGGKVARVGGGLDTYNWHMCNRTLLQDLLELSVYAGVSGAIKGPYKADRKGHISWRLNANPFMVERILSQDGGNRNRRQHTRSSVLAPRSAVEEFLDTVPVSVFNRKSSENTLYMRMKSGGSVTPWMLREMYVLADVVDVPPIYSTTSVSSVEETGETEPVYTLSVDHPLHRYAAGSGTVTKNCLAGEIVNQELLRVNQRIRERFGPDHGLIIHVHDSAAFICKEQNAEACRQIFAEEFGNTVIPSAYGDVHLTSDAQIGDNLLQVH